MFAQRFHLLIPNLPPLSANCPRCSSVIKLLKHHGFTDLHVSDRNDQTCSATMLRPSSRSSTFSALFGYYPRRLVIRVLLFKGLIKNDEFSLVCMVSTCKNYFVDRFVTRYQEQVPELLDIFQGKTSLADIGLAFEETDGAT